jgi:hypothetical protein
VDDDRVRRSGIFSFPPRPPFRNFLSQ